MLALLIPGTLMGGGPTSPVAILTSSAVYADLTYPPAVRGNLTYPSSVNADLTYPPAVEGDED